MKLRIGRLILRAPAPGGRERIASAIEAELRRLLAAGELPRRLREAGSVLRLANGRLETPAGTRAERLGAGVARAVHGQWRDDR